MRIPGRVLRFAALATLLGVLAVVLVLHGVPAPGTLATTVAGTVAGTGVPAPLLAVSAFAVLVMGLVPRTLLAAAAGLVFGPLAGAVYILLGATLGASVAFGVGRWLGRDFVAVQRPLARLDGWLRRNGVLGVMIVRLLPVAPFGLVSYAFGTSGVRPAPYLAGTVIGMVPATVVYVNLGANVARPGSVGFWASVVAAVVLGATTLSVTAWLARRRVGRVDSARASQDAGATSVS